MQCYLLGGLADIQAEPDTQNALRIDALAAYE